MCGIEIPLNLPSLCSWIMAFERACMAKKNSRGDREHPWRTALVRSKVLPQHLYFTRICKEDPSMIEWRTRANCISKPIRKKTCCRNFQLRESKALKKSSFKKTRNIIILCEMKNLVAKQHRTLNRSSSEEGSLIPWDEGFYYRGSRNCHNFPWIL